MPRPPTTAVGMSRRGPRCCHQKEPVTGAHLSFAECLKAMGPWPVVMPRELDLRFEKNGKMTKIECDVIWARSGTQVLGTQVLAIFPPLLFVDCMDAWCTADSYHCRKTQGIKAVRNKARTRAAPRIAVLYSFASFQRRVRHLQYNTAPSSSDSS